MSDEWYVSTKHSCELVWPELEKYENIIHYIYASTHSTYTIQYRLPEDIVEEIREALSRGKKKFVFYNSPETIIDLLVHKIQMVVEMMPDLDPSDFIFTTAAPHGQECYNKMADRLNWTRRFTVLSGDHFEQVVQHSMKPIIPYIGMYEIKKKKKKFLCFNKVHRLHRAKLLADMYKANLVQEGYYSFQGGSPDWLEQYKNYKFENRENDDFVNVLVEHEDEFPLVLNITEERHNPIDLLPEDIDYHRESYFSIITETIFYGNHNEGMTLYRNEDTLFISEKTYKAIAFKHPFLIFGCPGTLAHLHTAGYKTFHPYIDERYDSERDDQKRYEMLVTEIKRLCAMSESEWLDWQNNVKMTIEHNYLVLRNRQSFHQTKNIDKLFQ